MCVKFISKCGGVLWQFVKFNNPGKTVSVSIHDFENPFQDFTISKAVQVDCGFELLKHAEFKTNDLARDQ